MTRKRVTVGAYYFDGWAGCNRHSGDPAEPWAADAPIQLTRRLAEEFADREPLWGWRDDSMSVMKRQIDTAADGGIDFFAFCWYWHEDSGPIDVDAIRGDPKHTGIDLFMEAPNNGRMRFCLMLANHQGFEIKGAEAWRQGTEFWVPYFRHPRYMTVGGRPLLIVFNAPGGDAEGFACIQEAARRAGLQGVAIAGCYSAPPEMGYTLRTHYNVIPGYTAGSKPHPYSELVARQESEWAGTPGQPYMPCTIVGWDKRPWERAGSTEGGAWYFPDATPEAFGAHVRRAVAWIDRHPESTPAERIIMVYAWNEYGEGGYLAPTRGDPEARSLKALEKAVESSRP